MRPEVAQLLMFLFVPLMLTALAVRAWRESDRPSWPPPLSVIVSVGAIAGLLLLIWYAVIVP